MPKIEHRVATYDTKYHQVTYYDLYDDGTMTFSRKNTSKRFKIKEGYQLVAMLRSNYDQTSKKMHVLYDQKKYIG